MRSAMNCGWCSGTRRRNDAIALSASKRNPSDAQRLSGWRKLTPRRSSATMAPRPIVRLASASVTRSGLAGHPCRPPADALAFALRFQGRKRVHNAKRSGNGRVQS
jgi:hypothetical protein